MQFVRFAFAFFDVVRVIDFEAVENLRFAGDRPKNFGANNVCCIADADFLPQGI